MLVVVNKQLQKGGEQHASQSILEDYITLKSLTAAPLYYVAVDDVPADKVQSQLFHIYMQVL